MPGSPKHLHKRTSRLTERISLGAHSLTDQTPNGVLCICLLRHLLDLFDSSHADTIRLLLLIDSIKYFVVQCSAVQCSAVQCSAVQCSAVQCSAVQCGAVRCGAVRCGAVQCSAVQCSAVQCSAVQCSAVQCSAVQCTPFWTSKGGIRVSPGISILSGIRTYMHIPTQLIQSGCS